MFGVGARLKRRPERGSCGAEGDAFRGVPRRRRGSERGIPLLRNPACEQKEAHRVGVAFVQPTRSTFAEAIAGRESLQPPALRARCTRKPTGPFGSRQAPVQLMLSQIAAFSFSCEFSGISVKLRSSDRECGRLQGCAPPQAGIRARASTSAESRLRTDRSAPRPALPRPTFQPTAAEATACRRAINLGRSVLGALGTLWGRLALVKWEPSVNIAIWDLFFTHSISLRLSACALSRKGPGIRRAGCAFVHFPG